MPALPRAILFDLDDTIISGGPRHLLLQEVAEMFAAELAPFAPTEVAAMMEARYRAFWSDEDRHRQWRFRLVEARINLAVEAFAELSHRAPGATPEVAHAFAERFHGNDERIDIESMALSTQFFIDVAHDFLG